MKEKLLEEPFVQKSIVKYLACEGWGLNLTSRGLNEHGVDIKVKNNKIARYWLIETKGDPGIKVKSPYGSRISTFHSALGQIITRMHTTGKAGYKYRYKYGVGFPMSFKEMILKKLPYDTCDKLNLYLFFVNGRGDVEKYSHKEIKQIQKGCHARSGVF